MRAVIVVQLAVRVPLARIPYSVVVVAEIPAMDVIYVSVAIVIYSIAGYFAGISPDIRG